MWYEHEAEKPEKRLTTGLSVCRVSGETLRYSPELDKWLPKKHFKRFVER
jgi:hypothetical protein